MRAPLVCSSLILVSIAFAQTAPQPAAKAATPDKPTPAKAWSILDAALKDKSADKRAKAVHALGLIVKDMKAIQLAQAALSDPQAIVRTSAATSLGKLHAKSSLPALRTALEDKETEVVFAAADALTEMDDPTAYQLYYGVLTGQRKSGHGLLVDQAKALKDRKHLAQMGFERGLGAVPFGGWGYTAFQAIHQDDVSPVRAEAAEALASDPIRAVVKRWWQRLTTRAGSCAHPLSAPSRSARTRSWRRASPTCSPIRRMRCSSTRPRHSSG